MRILIALYLFLFPVLILSQPVEYRKDKLFDDGIIERTAKTFAIAHVKTQSIWMAVEFGKDKKYLYEQNTYDREGRVIETKDCLPDGKQPWLYKYKYNDDGSIAEKNDEYTIDSVTSHTQTRFYYDAKGRLINSSVSGVKEKKVTMEYLYDDIENTMTIKLFKTATVLVLSTTYYFNDKNWLIKGTSLDNEGKTGSSEISYFKDSIQIVEKENGVIKKIEGMTFDKDNHINQRRYSIPGQDSYIQYKAEYKNGIITTEKLNYKPEGYYSSEKIFDKNGNAVIENYYNAKNKISQKRILRYNDMNLLIGIAEGDENIDYDKSVDKIIYEYEYYK